MLWTIFIILLVLWLLGLIGHVGGALIHLVLVIAVIVLDECALKVQRQHSDITKISGDIPPRNIQAPA
jgi:Family of unknown function (DUF5670)